MREVLLYIGFVAQFSYRNDIVWLKEIVYPMIPSFTCEWSYQNWIYQFKFRFFFTIPFHQPLKYKQLLKIGTPMLERSWVTQYHLTEMFQYFIMEFILFQDAYQKNKQKYQNQALNLVSSIITSWTGWHTTFIT
jgi:hypothetical protein